MGYTWDSAVQRYRNPTSGRFVSPRDVRAEVDVYLENARSGARGLTQLLVDGRVSLGDWQGLMADEIKALHTSNAVLARGGWEQMADDDWSRLGEQVRDEYPYLRRWAIALEDGTAPLDGRALARADMYVQSARGTYEEAKRYGGLQYGFLWERNVLGATLDHCSGCREASDMGVRPVGEITAVGDRDCSSNCDCELIQYDKPFGDGDFSD